MNVRNEMYEIKNLMSCNDMLNINLVKLLQMSSFHTQQLVKIFARDIAVEYLSIFVLFY